VPDVAERDGRRSARFNALMERADIAGLGKRPVHAVSAILRRYFGARGPHLAAMLAYYALLSLFPFVFLAASLVSAIGRPEETSALLRDLSHVLPGTSAHDLARLVRSLGSNAAEIGVIGGIALLWSALGFLSALESGLNVLYGLPNRGFLHQKLVVLGLLGTALIALLLGLTIVVTSQTALSQVAPGLAHLAAWRIGGGLAISSLTTFLFLLLVYRTLPNTELTTRQVLPGALIATALLQLTFESLPLYVRSVEGLPALKAFGGAAVLLVWLYLMGNVVLLGGAITWWSSRGRAAAAATAATAAIGQAPESASV
jgi:membrane protein